MVSDVIADDDYAVEKSCAPKIFRLTVDGTESLPSLSVSLGSFCAGIEDHAEQSLAIIQLENAPARAPWPGDVTVQDASRWERAVRRLEHCGAIVMTTVRGECSGAGLDFLTISDYRIATPDFLLRLPVNNGQFWPGMSIYRLVQQLGIGRARQIVLWQPTMGADLCLSAGLIDEIAEDLQTATARMISLVKGQKGGELAVRRRLLLEATTSPYDEALGTHLAACDRELRRMREVDLG